MLDERDLVERHGLGARLGTGVVGATTLLQALERLALAGRFDEGVTARRDLGLMAVEIELTGLTRLCDALEVGLLGDQVLPAQRRGRRGPLSFERAAQLLAHRPQAIGAARPPGHRPGELLLGKVLTTLAQCAQTFEGEAERAHGPGSRPPDPELYLLDGCLTAALPQPAAAALFRRESVPPQDREVSLRTTVGVADRLLDADHLPLSHLARGLQTHIHDLHLPLHLLPRSNLLLADLHR